MIKKYSIIVIILFIQISLFSQEIVIQNNSRLNKVHFWWKKYKTYDENGNLISKDKYKRLFLIDPSTLRTRCYLRVKKDYQDNNCSKKEYSTITTGGCTYYAEYERPHDRRFLNFLNFRFKVLFLGNIGFKQLLYKHNMLDYQEFKQKRKDKKSD